MVYCRSIICIIKFVTINCINVVYKSNNQKGFIANLRPKKESHVLRYTRDTYTYVLHITSVYQLPSANEMCLCNV